MNESSPEEFDLCRWGPFQRLALSSEEPSYGRYTPVAASKVPKDSVIYLYIEPDNLHTVRDGGRYLIDFVQDLVLVDDAGSVYLEAPNLVEYSYASLSPPLDVFVHNRVNLQGLPSGEYRFIVTIRDLMGGDSAIADVDLTVLVK